MKKLFLSIVFALLSFSINAQLLINNDSTFAWSDTNFTFNRSLIAKENDNSFLMLGKKNDNSTYYLSTHNENLSSLKNKAMELPSLVNPTVLYYYDYYKIYIADVINNQAYIKQYDSRMFSSALYKSRFNRLLPNLKTVSKLEVYDSSGVSIIVGLGLDINNKSSFFKYKISNNEFNYSLINAKENELFLDLTVTNTNIIILSKPNNNAFDGKIAIRKINKFGQPTIGGGPVFKLHDYYEASHAKITYVKGDYVAFGLKMYKTLYGMGYKNIIGLYNTYTNDLNIKSFFEDHNYEIRDIDYLYNNDCDFLYVSVSHNVLKLNLSDNYLNNNLFPTIEFPYQIDNNGLIALNSRFFITKFYLSPNYMKSSFYFEEGGRTTCYSQYQVESSSSILTIYEDINGGGKSTHIKENIYFAEQFFGDNFEYHPEFYCAFPPKRVFKSNSVNGTECQIFPNPAKHEIFITSPSEIIKIEIFSLLGKKIYETNVYDINCNIKISDFNTGQYIVKIHNSSGVITKKIIIE